MVHERVLIAGAEGLLGRYLTAQLLGQAERERLIDGSHACAEAWIAPRPSYTPLRCLTSEQLGLPPMRHWSLALAEYFHEA